jgi:hypothetical protein
MRLGAGYEYVLAKSNQNWTVAAFDIVFQDKRESRTNPDIESVDDNSQILRRGGRAQVVG